MSLFNGIYSTFEGIFAWVSNAMKQNALSYCDLETADSKNTLVTKDGYLITVVQLHGYKRFVGPNEYVYLCERMTEMLQPGFSGSGHFVQFFFTYDQSRINKKIDEALQPAKKTAKRINLDIEDIFQSRVKTLSKFCADEACFMVLWTNNEAIESSHFKRLAKQRGERLKQYKLPRMFGAQSLFAVLDELRNIHHSFVSTVIEDLQHVGYYINVLDVHKACHEIRMSVDPNSTSEDWEPFLPGDRLPLQLAKTSIKNDVSYLMWPPLESQLIPRDGENIGLKFARIGDQIFSPIFIELFPKDIKPFYELFRRMLSAKMPWRMSYFIGGDGIRISQSKSMLATILAFSSHHNRLIADAHKLLKTLHERSDDPIVKLHVCLATWAPVGQEELLKERAAKLYKATQSWGNCQVGDVSGDAFGTTMSSALSMTCKIVATPSAAPLSDVVQMLPIIRPASPWPNGALLFRTPDGKIWPYQPGSSYQISWIDIVYARSGSGKSVLLNTLNLGLCLLPGLSNLPRISIIDVGPSSKGFISLLREGLSEARRHEVMYYRLSNDEKDAINPFDTQLGSRHPTRIHRSFLINFSSLLLVENIEDSLPEGMSSMISMIVDESYKRFSDNEQPKLYVRFSDDEIEAEIHKLDLDFSTRITWWQITDAFFQIGEQRLALKAQRYAMPTIADTVAIAYQNTIKDLFSEITTPVGENYIDAYSRIISGVIRSFPTLTSVTRLDFEGSKIVSLDLDEVAKSGSPAAEKQTAIMYMLARHVLGRDFFLNASEVEKMPVNYHEYHLKRTKEIMEEPKRIVFDEFHRTSKSPAIREQVLQDMREGRKWKIHIALSSQSLKDFDELMVEFATSVFVLDSGTSMSIDATCKTFGLTETERLALSTRVHGPSSEGATFIAQFVTKKGMNTQLLTSTISPVELWAFNTTVEDVTIRERLYQSIGPAPARRMLAERFPKGSATEEIEMILKNDSSATVNSICEQFADEIVNNYRRMVRKRNIGVADSGLL